MSKERQEATEFENATNEGTFLADGITRAFTRVLNNPVLPSEFDLVDPTSAMKHKWEFANGNRGPFAKARRGLQYYSTGLDK